MRIISGSHKGRRIIAPKKLHVRPTTDRSKEALFNILQHQYPWKDTSILDLYAGTGSISYEFASRGVEKITTVDQNKMCIDFIQKTAQSLDLQLQPVQMDAIKFITVVKTQFDLIFADPPYNLGDKNYIELIETIFDHKILKDGGLFIIEHGGQEIFKDHPRFSKSRKYGSNVLSFFE